MTVEIRPYGDKCNLRCQYCYENPLRDYNLPSTPPDWKKVKEELIKQDSHFTVFGGDPLVVPIEELEEIWKFGKEKWKQNGIQTNGSLISETHIALFKQYNVHVGFSIDGPHMLNDARSAPSGELNATRKLTDLSNRHLITCLKEGVEASLIVTLSKMNVSYGRVYYGLISWLSKLEEYGLEHVRLHLLENDDASDLIPNEDEFFEALLLLYDFSKTSNLKFDLFSDLTERLKTGKGGCCTFNECDPTNTRAVESIGPNGEITNCGRVNKEGIDFLKAGEYIPIRSYVLQATSQENGGCQGCKFWYACTGNCPGTGIGGDWRNRTTHCSILKRLMQHILDDRGMKLMESPPCKDNGHIDEHGNSYRDTPHLNHYDNTPHLDKVHLPRLEVRR